MNLLYAKTGDRLVELCATRQPSGPTTGGMLRKEAIEVALFHLPGTSSRSGLDSSCIIHNWIIMIDLVKAKCLKGPKASNDLLLLNMSCFDIHLGVVQFC